jgi:hypothetical protein
MGPWVTFGGPRAVFEYDVLQTWSFKYFLASPGWLEGLRQMATQYITNTSNINVLRMFCPWFAGPRKSQESRLERTSMRTLDKSGEIDLQ